jgi:signal transduction histidine kinase
VRRFATEADPLLKRTRLYHGTRLPGDRYAISTLGEGVVVIDADGRLVRRLSPEVHLPDGVVNHVATGREGELWMAFNSAGLMQADVLSPLSRIGGAFGLNGTVRSVARNGGRLYAATGMGLYVFDRVPHPGIDDPEIARQMGRPVARPVPEVHIPTRMRSTSRGLYVASQRGIYRIRGAEVQRLASLTVFDIAPSRRYPDRILAGTRKGLILINETTGERRPVEEVEAKVRKVHERPDGTLWLTTLRGRILRVRFPDGIDQPAVVRIFGAEDGLPAVRGAVTTLDGEVVFVSGSGVHRLVESGPAARFEPAPDLLPGTADDGPLRTLTSVGSQGVWALRGDVVYWGARASGKTYEWRRVDELSFPKENASSIYAGRDGIVWLTNGDELIRYDTGIHRTFVDDFSAYVRQVTAIRNGSVVYGGAVATGLADVAPDAGNPGAGRAGAVGRSLGGAGIPLRTAAAQASATGGSGDTAAVQHGASGDVESTVSYADNDLRFDFAAPMFNVMTPVQYQYRLEGVDASWSDWREQTSAVYTNLFEGRYRFLVRARNERGAESRTAAFAFRVVPPWYRTMWAYGFYTLCFVVVGFGFRRYYKAMEANEEARRQEEQLGRERLANERLQRANTRLRQANELKENFLASTSHELRTPLTNILGFADLLKEETETRVHPHLDVIEDNGRRLLRTLNALLDLASLRAGEMSPNLRRTNVSTVVMRIAREYRDRTGEKGIELRLDLPQAPVHALLDVQYLEQILHNLIDNAIKFTDTGGVEVGVEATAREVAVQVADTGIGIDAAFMPDLFRDFKQESHGLSRNYDGSGLGLAISARLVELMNGTITVRSEKGRGSTFTVRFPRRQAERRTPATPPDREEPAAREA